MRGPKYSKDEEKLLDKIVKILVARTFKWSNLIVEYLPHSTIIAHSSNKNDWSSLVEYFIHGCLMGVNISKDNTKQLPDKVNNILLEKGN